MSAETREVLAVARQVSEWTDGRFDVTFGALSGLWKFDNQDKDDRIPDRTEIERGCRSSTTATSRSTTARARRS